MGQSPRQLLAFNLSLLLVAIAAGALGKALDGPALQQQHSVWPALRGIEGSTSDVFYVFGANVRVVATLLFGACTFGLLTAVVLAWNGYALGAGIVELSLRAPEHVLVVMQYVPLEFAAFVLASAGSMSLAFRIGACLFAGERIAFKGPVLAHVAAVCMLAVAAAIEARAGRLIANP
ncbi:MAG: stage II sporulation protein M [Acidobacteriota bacterium]|nr:stage II sporulation protein M [Acidobacteriota bacterium]